MIALTKIKKIKEDPLQIAWFYLACIAGTATSIFVMVRGDLPPPSWAIVLVLLVYVYLAIDLLWWFGDHPEE